LTRAQDQTTRSKFNQVKLSQFMKRSKEMLCAKMLVESTLKAILIVPLIWLVLIKMLLLMLLMLLMLLFVYRDCLLLYLISCKKIYLFFVHFVEREKEPAKKCNLYFWLEWMNPTMSVKKVKKVNISLSKTKQFHSFLLFLWLNCFESNAGFHRLFMALVSDLANMNFKNSDTSFCETQF